MTETITSDFLIVGSGIAGLSLALKAAELGPVAVVTKRATDDTATDIAQGGLAAVMAKDDSLEAHVRDTLGAGAGLCDEEAVRKVVGEAPKRIRELIRWGVRFAQNEPVPGDEGRIEGPFELGLEGGHSKRRILHVGDYTGHAVQTVLAERARKHPRIRIFERHAAVNLITKRRLQKRKAGGKAAPPEKTDDFCAGAYVLDVESGMVKTFLAGATAICAGGAGKVYLFTSNPDTATGDGMALAWRAGAALANMEFVQFHPTCLFHPNAKNFLLTEALRGEGAFLKNRAGERFALKADPRGELAPRDIVARAIDAELKQTGEACVFLDITHRGPAFVRQRFPRVYEKCLSYGIDLTAQPAPVVPAAHYFCGGVRTDLRGRTSIPRLSAAGETACTGLHGANRLASNSLPEALVFAHAIAEDWKELSGAGLPLKPGDVPPWDPGKARDPDELVVLAQMWEEIRRFMWNYVGIVRTTKRLERALSRVETLREEIREYYWDFRLTPDLLDLRSIAAVAETVIRCALARKESRGLHTTLDFPAKDDEAGKRPTVLTRDS